MRDPFSHTFAAVMGWTRAPHAAEVAAYWLGDFFIAAMRGKNQVKQDPLPRPWERPRDDDQTRRSAADRADGQKKLQKRLEKLGLSN